ncbi:MAG: hypothetical protein FWC64_06795 [Treponema sp.]|nr:hypothetical protein [Treponema sp.]
MRLDNALPSFYTAFPQNVAPQNVAPVAVAASPAVVAQTAQANNLSRPGIVVDISPEGWAAYARSAAMGESDAAGRIDALEELRCATCDSRRYQDVSNDSSVSFQTPTHISPEKSAAAVRAHEYEHVANEQARADREGRRVVSQTVMLFSAICPECSRVYTSGGETRTVTAEDNRGGNTGEAAGDSSLA